MDIPDGFDPNLKVEVQIDQEKSTAIFYLFLNGEEIQLNEVNTLEPQQLYDIGTTLIQFGHKAISSGVAINLEREIQINKEISEMLDES